MSYNGYIAWMKWADTLPWHYRLVEAVGRCTQEASGEFKLLFLMGGIGKDIHGNPKDEEALMRQRGRNPSSITVVQWPQMRNKYETFTRPKEINANQIEKARERMLGKWAGAKPDRPSRRF